MAIVQMKAEPAAMNFVCGVPANSFVMLAGILVHKERHRYRLIYGVWIGRIKVRETGGRLGRLAVKAATAILLARSGRARAALPTSAQTSRGFPRTTSESNAARNCSGVAVPMVPPDALTARAKSSLALPRS